MIDRSIISQMLTISSDRRIIAISDIHANLPVFKKLLKKINYSADQDELFLVGDLLEKGSYNMDTLHYIMHMAVDSHVHPMMGNCDFVCKNILFEYRLDFLKEVLLARDKSIIHEMAQQLNIAIDKETDMVQLAGILKKHFLKELQFVNSLPHVIETQKFIFGHAAILNEDSYGEDMRDIMTHDRFLKDAKKFQKYVIVGHLPVSEYCQTICNFNPYFDVARHIICIDGGNGVKAAGQLNALLIHKGMFTYEHSDSLAKAQVCETFLPDNMDAHFITWHDSTIRILKQLTEKSLCEQLSNGKQMWIPNELIYTYHENYHADNFTTYQMPVQKGDFVKIVSRHGSHVLIKKDGRMGWIPKQVLQHRS